MKPVFLTPLALCCLARACWAVPVSIQVLGPDKKPVPGAQIRVRFWSTADPQQKAEPLSAVADAKGLATVEAPDENPNGGNDVRGYATAWSPALSMGAAMLKVGANDIALDAGGVARGMVVDDKGQPVANAPVRVATLHSANNKIQYALPATFSKTDGAVSEVRTDAAGRWSVSLAPLGGLIAVELAEDKFARSTAGSRAVDAQAPFDWTPVEAAARAAAQAPAVPDATMMGRKPIEDGVLVARVASAITGRVLDPNGAPVPDVSVIANSLAGGVSLAQMDKSNAQGEFRIARLNGGEYSLIAVVLDPASKVQWVPGEAVKIQVAAGASAEAPDLKMIQGGTIEVRLLDEATGKGIKGANVYSRGGGSDTSFAPSRPSDAEGRVSLRVAPGKRSVMMYSPPEDYLAPEHSTYNDATLVEVQAGEIKSVQWKLKKGLVGTGRLLDAQGKPIAGVSIGFRSSNRNYYSGNSEAQSDQAGRWKKGGFKPGMWQPYISGAEWKLVSPKEVSFPLKGELDFVLAPIARVPIAGRALDGEGKPLSGVSLSLKINIVQDSMGNTIERTATTQADGAWRVADVPEIAQSMSIQATRPGYAVHRAPKATKTDLTWTASDAVLKKRDARLAGRILGADGQPATGAQVLVASTRALVKADAQGRWNLSDLPSGEVEIIAVSGAQAGAITTNAPNEAATLKLKAPQVLAARDVDRAQAVVEDAWETSRGSQYSGRDTLPAVLAASDPDEALLLAGGAAKKPSAASVLHIVRVLARSGDLDALQSWTQNNLDAINEPSLRQGALLLVAQPLVGHDDEAAKKWLAQARAGHAALKEDYQRRISAQAIAVLAARLKEADAEALFEQALALAKEGGNGPNNFPALALAVAPVSEEWAVKVIEAAIAAAPTQPKYSEGPDVVAGGAIRSMAPTNLAGARRLLLKYGGLKGAEGRGMSWDMSIAPSIVLGQRAKAGEDVDTLLKEVSQEQPATRAIALVADGGPPARRVELLRRALELAQRQDHFNMNETFQVLRRLAPLDRETTRAALDRARPVLEAPRDESDDYNRLRAADVANWAWLYGAFDPGAARLMIEREWALGVSLAPSDQDDWRRWPGMAELVAAMMPLDIERAQQLAERLPISGYNSPAFNAQRAIARWMVASAEERASKPLSFWSADRDEDGRYSNEW